ncbi:MAG TPA: Crp/Fnr family transcriptional regulator [Stellaceae bacterium]|nr:Crp/Fnr family transcriptional regulator [Stellaceae bacterium]
MATQSAAIAPRPKVLINHKLSVALPLAAAEASILLDLKAASRSVRPGQEIVSEGKRCNTVFLITEGMAIRYRILRDGQRQILNFLLPGDFAGVTSCHFDAALYSIRTLTQTTISPIPLVRLIGLFDSHPQAAAKLFWSFACESAVLAERLIAIGRHSAAERVAHLLLELLFRLQRIGLADERSFRLPLTQEMISDALGLSVPYVNRVLRQLRDDGLVRIKDQLVIIDNLEELSAFADFEHGYLTPLSIADSLTEPC